MKSSGYASRSLLLAVGGFKLRVQATLAYLLGEHIWRFTIFTPDMSIPTPEIRLAILFAAAFAIVLFLAVIIIMHSLGNMENYLKRMQFIISKEIILRYNQQVNYYKQQRQRFIAQQERDKRQEALLEIPLVRNSEHNLKDKL